MGGRSQADSDRTESREVGDALELKLIPRIGIRQPASIVEQRRAKETDLRTFW